MTSLTTKQVALALGLAFVAAATVVGTYVGAEVIVTAGWLALAVVGVLFIRPAVGIGIMTAGYLLTAYPTVLQALGSLTVSNLIGVVLLGLLVAQIVETRDFSFMRVRQVQILTGIAVLLLIGSIVAEWQFPMLTYTVGKTRVIDRTARASHDTWTRLVYLIFFCTFVRTRGEVKAMFIVMMLTLYVAVPSALYNVMTGQLSRGFRAASSVTLGTNANRLGMICLIEIALIWHWSRMRPGILRHGLAMVAMMACVTVLMATGSRSGILGLGMFAILMQTGPRHHRVSAPVVGVLILVGTLAVATLVPAEAWQRMIRFDPQRGESGESSSRMREETLERAWIMAKDYPLFGIGLGNFREVARQIYFDDYFRPPHNSYLWALSEGGIFVLAGYALLFWVTWKDLQRIRMLAGRDPEFEAWASAVRVVFLLFFFYSLFADLWVSPLCYLLLGLVFTTRRYLESLPEVPSTATAPVRAVRPLGRAA